MKDEFFKVWDYAKNNSISHEAGYDKKSFNYVNWWMDEYINAEKEKKTYRVGVSKVKNVKIRRFLIVLLFSILFTFNVFFGLIQAVLCAWTNQQALFESVKEHWKDKNVG
ncbi:MAG: hypothetical protein WC679_01255 [Bacteroidales bacterium]|jgi:hypothetical protein